MPTKGCEKVQQKARRKGGRVIEGKAGGVLIRKVPSGRRARLGGGPKRNQKGPRPLFLEPDGQIERTAMRRVNVGCRGRAERPEKVRRKTVGLSPNEKKKTSLQGRAETESDKKNPKCQGSVPSTASL